MGIASGNLSFGVYFFNLWRHLHTIGNITIAIVSQERPSRKYPQQPQDLNLSPKQFRWNPTKPYFSDLQVKATRYEQTYTGTLESPGCGFRKSAQHPCDWLDYKKWGSDKVNLSLCNGYHSKMMLKCLVEPPDKIEYWTIYYKVGGSQVEPTIVQKQWWRPTVLTQTCIPILGLMLSLTLYNIMIFFVFCWRKVSTFDYICTTVGVRHRNPLMFSSQGAQGWTCGLQSPTSCGRLIVESPNQR